MKTIAIVMLVLAAACGGKSGAEQAKEEHEKEMKDHPAMADDDSGAKKSGTAPVAKPDAPPPAPEPTTPAEIDHARNQAMIDGKDKDVLKYCEMGKLDDKSNPQALLGCTLAACRVKDDATARRYFKPLTKQLAEQAKKVCATSQIIL